MSLLEIIDLEKTFYTPDNKVSAHIVIPRLKLEQGEAMVLEGPSGSGKTTVLHMISGLLKPDKGSIYFEGTDVTKMTAQMRDQWRGSNIGYIFQKLNLLPAMTAEENILLAGKWHAAAADLQIVKNRMYDLLKAVGLANKAKLYPNKLSIGEQQRIAVVRALLYKPKMILADEPTASLDRANSEKVLQLLWCLCQENNVALMLCTHDEFIKNKFTKRYNVRKESYNE